MSRLVLTADTLTRLRQGLLAGPDESCAVLFGRSVEVDGRLARIVVREALDPQRDDYLVRDALRARLRPELVAAVAQRARRTGESIVFVHTHPGGPAQFSPTDDAGERALLEFLRGRTPDGRHAALLLTPHGSAARELDADPLRILGVGPEVTFSAAPEAPSDDEERFDRQVRAFGRFGQAVLRSVRVGIVGLGGTGSVVLQELAHLGVRDVVLVDPDTVESTNLNRLVGATAADIGKPKVEVASRWARRLAPEMAVDARLDTVLKAASARALTDVDLVFCCTDSHGSRAVLNQLAYQYLVPIIDMGVVIATAGDGRVTHVAARTQLLAPGLACQVCANLLDPEEVRRDLLSDFERKSDPYILGAAEPAPAVISLNATIASLAVTMFLNTVAGVPGSARMLNYNGLTGACRPASCAPHPSCVVCSPAGALARGDEWPLPARRD